MSVKGISLEVVNLATTRRATDYFHVFTSYESTPVVSIKLARNTVQKRVKKCGVQSLLPPRDDDGESVDLCI